MTEPLKIDKKIVSYKVLTDEPSKEDVTHEEVFEDVKDITRVESLEYKVEVMKDLKRPIRLDNTWRLKPPSAEHALYVSLSAITIEDRKYPFEIFFNTKNPEHIEWTNALTLTISNAFRTAIITGSSLESLISNLKETIGTSGTYISKVPKKPKFVNGIVAEIGYVIAEFYSECLQWNYSQSSNELPATEVEKEAAFNFNLEEIRQAMEAPRIILPKEAVTSDEVFEGWINNGETSNYPLTAKTCTKCGEKAVILMDGCMTCLACADSKCG